MPARAARPKRCADEGLPKASFPRYGSMASSTSGRTGVVAALSRYVTRLVMEGPIYQLDGLHAKLEHVLHFEGLRRVERLAVAPPDERTVMGRLHADQLVQVLAGGVDLAGRLGAGELRLVAANRVHLLLEHVGDVHHERRLDRVFSIRQSVEELIRPVRFAPLARCILREAGEIAGIASQLRCDTMIGVPT